MIIRLCESIEYFGGTTPEEHEIALKKIMEFLRSKGFYHILTVNSCTDSQFSLWSKNPDEELTKYSEFDEDFNIFDEQFWN
jgi:hypothetical protein